MSSALLSSPDEAFSVGGGSGVGCRMTADLGQQQQQRIGHNSGSSSSSGDEVNRAADEKGTEQGSNDRTDSPNR